MSTRFGQLPKPTTKQRRRLLDLALDAILRAQGKLKKKRRKRRRILHRRSR
jgi:hypothetical protein